jgi:hypothetical protein
MGFVYLIGPSNGTYKIGKTIDLASRVKQLTLPHGADVLHTIQCENFDWLEKYLHKAFHHCRVKGEWFSLTPLEVEIVKNITMAEAATDLPFVVQAMYGTNGKALMAEVMSRKGKERNVERDEYTIEEAAISLNMTLDDYFKTVLAMPQKDHAYFITEPIPEAAITRLMVSKI